MNEQDPMGLYYPSIGEISDISRPGSGSTLRDPAVGTTLTTGRTVWPGERVSLRCRAYDGSRQSPVTGDDVVLSWDVDSSAIGESVYVGIGMAADSHYYRQGGRDEQGYDGWVVLFYRVPPAQERWSAGQVVTGRFAEGTVTSEQGTGQRSRVN